MKTATLRQLCDIEKLVLQFDRHENCRAQYEDVDELINNMRGDEATLNDFSTVDSEADRVKILAALANDDYKTVGEIFSRNILKNVSDYLAK